MTFYFTKSEQFELEGSFTKGELISFLEQLDSDDAKAVQAVEVVLDEGTSRDVTADIAQEMADAHQFHAFDGDFDSETGIPEFALHHCETELRERLADETKEGRVIASDQRLDRAVA